ncbi:MAG: exodeoxyribonuclease VII large subunit [bacterium]
MVLSGTTRDVLTVSELTRHVKLLLENELPPVWVTGEISNFKRHDSGHFYFSLKDEGAQIPCVMWAGRNRGLNFMPHDGMQVLVHGQITVYEKRGYYQLEIWQLQRAGIGALQAAFEQLKKRLAQEGLFDPAHKVSLPPFPQRVGLVTSPTGAAIRDLISVLRRRWPSMKIILRPVRVQGKGAAEEIAAAIAEFNAYGEVDLLIVGRGGGALEDLWPFNEEIVARAIYASTLPVISAVGHEIDFSISDFVADVRAATPSVAAEMAAPDAAEMQRALRQQARRMLLHLQRAVHVYRERLQSFHGSYGMRRPVEALRQRIQELDEWQRRLVQALRQIHQQRSGGLETAYHRMQALSHENVLRRGFALVWRERDQQLVRAAGEVTKEDVVRIQFARDAVRAKVQEKIEGRTT